MSTSVSHLANNTRSVSLPHPTRHNTAPRNDAPCSPPAPWRPLHPTQPLPSTRCSTARWARLSSSRGRGDLLLCPAMSGWVGADGTLQAPVQELPMSPALGFPGLLCPVEEEHSGGLFHSLGVGSSAGVSTQHGHSQGAARCRADISYTAGPRGATSSRQGRPAGPAPRAGAVPSLPPEETATTEKSPGKQPGCLGPSLCSTTGVMFGAGS